ncbi:hypothetical protein GY45DRAFT_265617 [Cubamyces sp. BRFM 1775]|nr:hypothetical protein GY45DRAFT_265617 [Cubamyces sp. BRFM 1775]
MDPTIPVYIAKGAAATSVAAGTFTALHALFRGSRHPTPLALSAAANGGIAGTIFFGLREVLVSPIIRTALHAGGYSQDPSSSGRGDARTPPSWAHLRMHGMLETALSGALTGAIINKWRKGNVIAGARTAGLLCALVQLGFNEVGVMRIKYVSRKLQEAQRPPDTVTPTPVPVPTEVAEPKVSVFDRLMGIIGFRKLSDEEYLKVLKKQRDEALERIAVLEWERSEREKAEGKNEVSGDGTA